MECVKAEEDVFCFVVDLLVGSKDGSVQVVCFVLERSSDCAFEGSGCHEQV